MKKENRSSGEKSNSLSGVKKVFVKQFKTQLKKCEEKYKLETGKKIKIPDIKKELAEYVGVDVKTISKWNTGTDFPEIENLIKVAEFFSCSIDELFTNKNPYDEIKQKWEEKKLNEKAIEKAELLLREPPKIKPLWGDDDIPVPRWNTNKFFNDLLCSEDIDELIGYYFNISKEFFGLTNAEVEAVNASIKNDNLLESNKLLSILCTNLPKEVQDKILENKNNIDTFIMLHTASYILKMYYDETQNKNNTK